jgi:DNA modification methylase
VLDVFGGSGSTLIGCETTNRVARLLEIDTKFVDVTVRRWETFSGKEAVLDGDGRTFEAIRKHRLGL